MRLVNGGASGGRAGGGRAHRVTHKIVKNVQSSMCHHVKRISSTGFIFHTHCNEWAVHKKYIYIASSHIVKNTGYQMPK